jgi:hypothetical protein
MHLSTPQVFLITGTCLLLYLMLPIIASLALLCDDFLYQQQGKKIDFSSTSEASADNGVDSTNIWIVGTGWGLYGLSFSVYT